MRKIILVKKGAAQPESAARHSNCYVALFVECSDRSGSIQRGPAVELHSKGSRLAEGGELVIALGKCSRC